MSNGPLTANPHNRLSGLWPDFWPLLASYRWTPKNIYIFVSILEKYHCLFAGLVGVIMLSILRFVYHDGKLYFATIIQTTIQLVVVVVV